MRHQVKGSKLGRNAAHRRAMFRNQLSSLIEHGRIRTTLAKAKALRPLADKMITQGKVGDVSARRRVRRWLTSREVVKMLCDEVAPRFEDRQGGYTRILKLGPRRGDGAEMALLEWVDYEFDAE